MATPTPPPGWFARGSHEQDGISVPLEYSRDLDLAGRPRWERPIVVCIEHCGLEGQRPTPGITPCYQHYPKLRRLCLVWVMEQQEQNKVLIEERRRNKEGTKDASFVAEQVAGPRPMPDRFSFRGTSPKFVSGGRIEEHG